VDDVYATAAKLEEAGCEFKKKPDEGRMKGLAFVYDPDYYWVGSLSANESALLFAILILDLFLKRF
jgi:lactoylglutathione lyase